jgi:hypothetical protein
MTFEPMPRQLYGALAVITFTLIFVKAKLHFNYLKITNTAFQNVDRFSYLLYRPSAMSGHYFLTREIFRPWFPSLKKTVNPTPESGDLRKKIILLAILTWIFGTFLPYQIITTVLKLK